MGPNPFKWRLDAGQLEMVDETVVRVLREKTPAERIAMTAAAHRTARALLAAGVRFRHPDWTDEQVNREVVRRLTRGAD